MGTISHVYTLKRTWRKKYIYLLTLKVSKKYFNTFPIEDVFHLPSVSTTPVVPFELRISRRIFSKFQTSPMVRSSRKLIHKKTWSRKSRGTVSLMSLLWFIFLENEPKTLAHVLARVWEIFEHFWVSLCRKNKKKLPDLRALVSLYKCMYMKIFLSYRVNFDQWITMTIIKNWLC
jgi:hypothetical protein